MVADLWWCEKVHDGLALLQRHEHPALSLGQGEKSAVRASHGDEESSVCMHVCMYVYVVYV